MKRVFADTYFFYAIINPDDGSHAQAIDFAADTRLPLLTTAWVLTGLPTDWPQLDSGRPFNVSWMRSRPGEQTSSSQQTLNRTKTALTSITPVATNSGRLPIASPLPLCKRKELRKH
jgi:hypothetical protein